MTKQQKKNWPKNAMVGYIDTTATGSLNAITAGQTTNYDVIIFGFSEPDGTISAQTAEAIYSNRQLQSSNTLNLLSVGGANGTSSLTSATIDNLLSTLADNQLDGIDLDIEDNAIPLDELATFVEQLRERIDNNYLLTIAPILAGKKDAPSLNIPSGYSLEPIYSKVPFDAILVQAYNSELTYKYPLPSAPNVEVAENSPNIISAAYNSLQRFGNIHKDSKIVIGIPSNAGGAISDSNLWNTDDYQSVPPLIKQNLEDIVSGRYQINAEQFGGLMAWSLNTDALPSAYPGYQNYQNGPAGYFAEHVAPLLKSLND